MLVWAGFSVAAVALAACAGGQSGADSSPTGLYGRGLDQIANLYIEPISTRRVALAGIARLSRIDDRLAISDSGDTSRGHAFGLNYDGHSVAFYSMPADGNNRDWGELVGSLVATARQTSPRLAALPEETIEK